MRAVIYIRTSSLGQVDREGPKVQEDSCRDYCARLGFKVVAALHEKATQGAKGEDDMDAERPVYADALAMIAEGEADVLVIYSIDRIARKLTTQEALLAAAWRVEADVHAFHGGHIPQDDPDDPFRTAMRQMMGVFAQLDKAMLTKRMRDGKAKKRARGEFAGGRRPFGMGRDEHETAREQNVLAYVRALVDEGLPLTAITTRLNNRGAEWYPRTGRPWTRQNLAKVIDNAGIARDALAEAS